MRVVWTFGNHFTTCDGFTFEHVDLTPFWNQLFVRFKELADKKHEIYDEDIHALVSDAQPNAEEVFKLVSLEVMSKTGTTPEAKLVLSVSGAEKSVTATGSGPVDATFRAIEAVANSGTTLELYSVNAITSGTDSQGEVTMRLSQSGRIINGHGADTDIVIASAKAYLNALNLLRSGLDRAHPQAEAI